MAPSQGKISADPQQILDELRKVPRGEVSLAQVLGLHPDVLAQMVARAQGMVDQGQLEQAEELLVDLARVEITIPNIPFLLGVCRYERRDFTGAAEAFTQALERGQRVSADFRQQAYLARAQAWLQAGVVEQAIADLEQAAACGDDKLAESARGWLAQLEKTRGSG